MTPIARWAVYAILTIVVIAAARYDARTRRVSNRLVYPLALVGLGLALARTALGDFTAAQWIVIGVAVAVGLVLLFSGAYGGGDAKLFVALALFLPSWAYLYAQLGCFVVGGLLVMLLNRPVERWREMRALWTRIAMGHLPTRAEMNAAPPESRSPATWQVAAGAILTMWVLPFYWSGS